MAYGSKYIKSKKQWVEIGSSGENIKNRLKQDLRSKNFQKPTKHIHLSAINHKQDKYRETTPIHITVKLSKSERVQKL